MFSRWLYGSCANATHLSVYYDRLYASDYVNYRDSFFVCRVPIFDSWRERDRSNGYQDDLMKAVIVQCTIDLIKVGEAKLDLGAPFTQ